MMGAGTTGGCRVINRYHLQCKHDSVFPFACRLEFWRQGSIFFWVNTVCAMNISLGWLGFYSQGKVVSKCIALSLILRLWDVFVFICSKNTQFVTIFVPLPVIRALLWLAVWWHFGKLSSAWAEYAGAVYMTPCSVESWFLNRVKINEMQKTDCLLY